MTSTNTTTWEADFSKLADTKTLFKSQIRDAQSLGLTPKALDNLKIQLLSTERLINVSLDTAYNTHGYDLWMKYKENIVPIRWEPINDIWYNNAGQPPKFNTDTFNGQISQWLIDGASSLGGFSNQAYASSLSFVDSNRGDLRLACEALVSELSGDRVARILSTTLTGQNAITDRMRDDILGIHASPALAAPAAALCNGVLGPKPNAPEIRLFMNDVPTFDLPTSTPNIALTSTTDPLASLLTRYRHDLATEDYALVNAAEVRSLVSAQGGSEAWGGVDLMEFSGSYIGDYWNFSNSGLNYTFGARIDYSLATGSRLSLADNAAPNFGGLDLMPSFSIGNSNTLLSNGSFGTRNLSYEAWQYNGSAWYTPTLNLSIPATPTIAQSYPTTSQIASIFSSIPSSSDTTFYYYGSNGSAYEWFIPVALDLDGDGIELVGQQDSRAWFDVKGDGFRRNIGWIGADDAFLAIDKNNDGKISQADELSFALWTADANDSDLEALKTVFDSNHDGKISAADTQFNQLRVWQDKNGDGVTDAGELKTLAQAGMVSLNLAAAQTDWVSGGNRRSCLSAYRQQNRKFINFCPKYAANDPARRAAA